MKRPVGTFVIEEVEVANGNRLVAAEAILRKAIEGGLPAHVERDEAFEGAHYLLREHLSLTKLSPEDENGVTQAI